MAERIRRRISARRRARLWRALVIAAALIATVAAVVRVVSPDQPPGPPAATSPGNRAPTASPTARSGPVDSGSVASCAYAYNRRTLADRDWAVDAAVVRMEVHGNDAWVGLRVHRWYRGGAGPEVSVGMPAPVQQEDAPPSYGVGTRLLVSGDRDGAYLGWSCGFTRYYDRHTAAVWQRVFG